jgi:hypothetical protein
MDRMISSLENASTSAELASAVDYFPKNEEFFTPQIRNLILAKKDLITDAETADTVIKFLLPFSGVEHCRPLLRTKEVQDLLINTIAPIVDTIWPFGRTICRFVCEDEAASTLMSSIESFVAILKCFHRSTTSQDARWMACSIDNILSNNPSSSKLLSSLPVVEAFSFIIPLANDDDEAVWSISDALQLILKNNEEAQQKFGTPEFLEIFQCMEQHATTDASKKSFTAVVDVLKSFLQQPVADATTSSQLKSAVDSLPQSEEFFTSEVRDLLLSKKDLITDAEAADSVIKFLLPFSGSESVRPLLRTSEVHDLLINHIAPHVTAVLEFGRTVCRFALNDEAASKLISTVESFAAILKSFHRSKSAGDVRWIASSINNILNNNPSANKILNSLPVVEAFSFIIPLADDADAVEWISRALDKILYNNEEALKKFATPEFFKIFQEMKKCATNRKAKDEMESVIRVLEPIVLLASLPDVATSSELKSTFESLPRIDKYFTQEVRDHLVAKKNLIVDAETADSVVKFLYGFTYGASSSLLLLQTKEVQDLIINNIAPHADAIYELGHTIQRIVGDNEDVAELYSNVDSFSAILKCFHRSKSSDDARWIASFFNNILAQNPSSNKLLNSLPVVEAFSFIIPLANDHYAVECISLALKRIVENNEEAQKKFATPEFFDIFQGMEQHATSDESKTAFKSVVDVIKQ